MNNDCLPLLNAVSSSLDVPPDQRELGHLAVWTVTSAKAGNGVDMLRDGREDTFWQSDGVQPHLVDIRFQKKVRVSSVKLLLNHRLDESYTPRVVCVRGGSGHADLRTLKQVEMEEPQGWVELSWADGADGGGTDDGAPPAPKLFMLQIMILANHQNGKDTHLRAVQIYGPGEEQGAGIRLGQGELGEPAALGDSPTALARPSNLSRFGESYHYIVR